MSKPSILRPAIVRDALSFVRRDGDTAPDLALVGLGAVIRALDDELSSDALRELDEAKVVGLSIAARVLVENLVDRIGEAAEGAA